jgi:hypothetical protein
MDRLLHVLPEIQMDGCLDHAHGSIWNQVAAVALVLVLGIGKVLRGRD